MENYLKDLSIPVVEKRQFLGLFPLGSATTGYRLYGAPPAPFHGTTVRADDYSALEAVIRWKADPSLSPLEGKSKASKGDSGAGSGRRPTDSARSGG